MRHAGSAWASPRDAGIKRINDSLEALCEFFAPAGEIFVTASRRFLSSAREKPNRTSGTDPPGCLMRHTPRARPTPLTSLGKGRLLAAAMPAHAAFISVLVMDRPMCLSCIADKAGVSKSEADAYLCQIASTLLVHRRAEDRCRACGIVTIVWSISRPQLLN